MQLMILYENPVQVLYNYNYLFASTDSPYCTNYMYSKTPFTLVS